MEKTSHYDVDAADYAVMFIESLCHTKGTWARKPFELIDWQEQIIRDIFGVLKPNGYRQFNIRKNCSLFITLGTLSQLTGNTSICNTSKINFRRLEALSCGVWPSPDFSLLSSRISLQNRKKCRFEPTFKKACPARLSERKSLISSGFRRVRGLQKRPQNGHPRHSCIKDSKSVCEQSHMGSNPILSAKKVQ